MVEQRFTQIEGDVRTLLERTARIEAAVIGDPTATDKPGLHIRVDRVERTVAALGKLMWLIVGAVVASGVTFFLTGG